MPILGGFFTNFRIQSINVSPNFHKSSVKLLFSGYYKSPAPLPPKSTNGNQNEDITFNYRKALVIYDYNKKTTTEMSLEKSQVVSVLDAKPGAEWWRVKDELGRIGYYPSHYLRMV